MALTDPILVVDEMDNPIGSAPMQEVRQQGLIHRIARVMVEDSSGSVLLQKRAEKLLWPNCWDNSAAGHVDDGEDYLTAAKRELFEEIGVKAEDLEEVGVYYTEGKIGENILKRFNGVFRLVTNDVPMPVSNDEVTEVRWFTVPEVKEFIRTNPDKVTDGLVEVFERYY